MSGFLTSVLGVGLVIGLAVPVATLAAKAILVFRWRRDPDPRRYGSLSTFLLLIAPSLGALAWFISAGLHLSEPVDTGTVCSLGHEGTIVCAEALLFVLLLSTLAMTTLLGAIWLHASGTARQRPRLPAGHAHARRLARICSSHPRLRELSRRITAVYGQGPPLCTKGLFMPVIEVAARCMERLPDDALTGALLHEAEHHHARDPLRYLVAGASLVINPCGFLLRQEFRRWRAAREAVCDEWAVRRSADPLALAGALVAVARHDSALRGSVVGLCGPALGLLRLRIHFLLDYASRPPGPRSSTATWLAILVGMGIVLLPHVVGAWPLEDAHAALVRVLAASGLTKM